VHNMTECPLGRASCCNERILPRPQCCAFLSCPRPVCCCAQVSCSAPYEWQDPTISEWEFSQQAKEAAAGKRFKVCVCVKR